jgi:cholest-4-en-3-one 26-monooxygenase
VSEAAPLLADPATFVAGVPHERYAWLRANDPVHAEPDPDGGTYWAVTRYADVVTVSRDPAVFSSGERTALLIDLPPEELQFMKQQMIHMDDPQHARLRALVSAGFTPRMIRRLETHVAELAVSIVDAVAAKGECDFVTSVAAELPLQVLGELLGVPQEDRWKLFDWSNRLIGHEDPEYGSPIDLRVALMEMFNYAYELAGRKRAAPDDDIVSALVTAEIDGERLTDIEFNMFFFLLVVAGNETTRNAISGGMEALCLFPAERARLLADPSLLPSAMEEILRWVTPVMQFRRTAMQDVSLGAADMRAGDKVVMYHSSANRDAGVFGETADRFDVGRSPNPHVAFGFGPHFCLGASLARVEMRAMFSELLRRLPDIELAGPVERLRSNFINGIKHLPVRFTPA